MENKVMSKEQAKEAVSDLMDGVKLILAVASMDCPGNKDVLLDVMIEGLENLAGRKEACSIEGACKCNSTCKDAACDETPMPSGVTFGTALAYLKDGWKVARKGWNGKGQYVELAECISYRNRAGDIVNADHRAIGNAALAFVGTSGVQLGWLASQADMLAEDWYVVE